VGGFLADGEHAVPAAEEQAQVDVRGHHQAHLPIARYGDLLVRPLALMHAVLIARQRHDRAQLAEGRQQRGPFRAQAHGIDAEAAGGQLGLAHIQVLRGIAGAQARFLGTQRLPGAVQLGSRRGKGSHRRNPRSQGDLPHRGTMKETLPQRIRQFYLIIICI
jgi:hypothetical protein